MTGRPLLTYVGSAEKAVIVLPWVRRSLVNPFCPSKNTVMLDYFGLPVTDLFETGYLRRGMRSVSRSAKHDFI